MANSTRTAASDGKGVFVSASVFKAARAGIGRDESTQVYDAWAVDGGYDKDMNDDEKYFGGKAVAEALCEMYPTDRERVLILDLGCGTGIAAERLQKLGFKKIHGLDPSPGMLEEAKKKKVYEKLICCYVDDSPLTAVTDKYDCLVSSGAFCEGHIPTSGLRRMASVVKPGGAVVIVMREAFLWDVAEYKDRLEKEMADMEREGLWRLVSRKQLPNYFHYHTGVAFTLRLPA